MRSPKTGTHWSTRSLARELGMSHMAVQRIWKKHGLQPHRVETFKLSRDPEFDRKRADVVGLYLDPPERALVLCVDEKSQIQALNRTQPILPLRPGIPARMTHDYHSPPRDPSHLRQLRDAQAPEGRRVAGCPSPLPRAFHAHERVMAEPRRELVLGAHAPGDPTR
jgi:hypothetical protein